MSEIYDKYVAELEDYNNKLETLDLTTTEGVTECLTSAYNLYRNGNFLMINGFAAISKVFYKSSGVKDIIDLSLNMFLLGPTKILDLDYTDQKNFLLNKAEFLVYYALNVDSSYKDMALKELNKYANMYTDGAHLHSKALLEKPSDPDDTLSYEVYKNYLYEYFSYGHELSDEELSVLGIDKSYLDLTQEELELKIKENKNDNIALKAIYYVLLNKGNFKYVYDLAKIDNVFKSTMDYYVSRRDEYSVYGSDNTTANEIVDKTKVKYKKKGNKWFIFNLLLVLAHALILYLEVYSGTHDQIYAMGFEPSMANALYYITILLSINLIVLILVKKSKAVNIIFSILLVFLTYIFYNHYPFRLEVHNYYNLIEDITLVALVLSIIKGFVNTSKLKQ